MSVSAGIVAVTFFTRFRRDSWIFHVDYVTLILRDVIYRIPVAVDIDMNNRGEYQADFRMI